MNVTSIDDLTFYRTYYTHFLFVANKKLKTNNNKINFNGVYICIDNYAKGIM